MARYYDAGVGRFITGDVFQGIANQPLSLNNYIYANDNPVMLIDPTGFFSVTTHTGGGKDISLLKERHN